MRKIFFAIPAHSGDIKCGTVSSLVQSVAVLRELGMDFELQIWAGDSLLPHARNVLIAKFMASDCSDLCFFDADMAWNLDAFMRLLQAPAEFVAGAYRFKNDTERYPVRFLDGATTAEVTDDGLCEVLAVPMGFARLTRSAIERMIDANLDKTYVHESCRDLICHLLFDLEYSNNQYWGEDFVFCKKFREAGGKIYLIDPETELTHMGQKSFTGSLGAYLRAKAEPKDDMIPRSKIIELFGSEKYDRLIAAASGVA
jgi:hypothetical protein